ncbi:MAG: hemolysin family protein [Microgenomates group bacterium]|nr:HlyC/CorC family transporter [Candidatus Woesebacteria bacterium]MBP6883441.1 HlyC/CorC family transporter [Candidatus Woesebacteria bacterium]
MEFIFQFGLVLLLVFLNGFFVASEFALVAVRKTRIDVLVKKGNKPAKLVQKSIAQLDTFISATQLGITLASLALGWIGEPAIARFIEPALHNILPQGAAVITSHSVAFVIAFTIITFLHIVLGELAPKTIALKKAETTSLFIIAPLTLFATVFKPFIWVLNEVGNLVLRLVGFSAPSGRQLVHSEEEIKIILAQSVAEGALEKNEVEMVYSVLKLGDTPVSKVMIPKSKIIAFEKKITIAKILKTTQSYQHSRFPIYENTMDNIVGFVHIKDIYAHLISDKKGASTKEIHDVFLKAQGERTLAQIKIIRSIPRVKEVDRIDDVLVLLRAKRVHIAVVVGEDGATSGLVALEDIVEKLVGEIKDEFDGIFQEERS